jgi:hypothetical protein
MRQKIEPKPTSDSSNTSIPLVFGLISCFCTAVGCGSLIFSYNVKPIAPSDGVYNFIAYISAIGALPLSLLFGVIGVAKNPKSYVTRTGFLLCVLFFFGFWLFSRY